MSRLPLEDRVVKVMSRVASEVGLQQCIECVKLASGGSRLTYRIESHASATELGAMHVDVEESSIRVAVGHNGAYDIDCSESVKDGLCEFEKVAGVLLRSPICERLIRLGATLGESTVVTGEGVDRLEFVHAFRVLPDADIPEGEYIFGLV